MLEYDILDTTGDEVVLQLRGELSGGREADHLRRSLDAYREDQGVRRIRVDVAALRFLDSTGVAILLQLRKEASERGKRFTVEGANGQVREKLSVTGLLDVLQAGNAGGAEGPPSPDAGMRGFV